MTIEFSETPSTFDRLGLQVNRTVMNFGEGFCFRYGIPKEGCQLVTHFDGVLSHNNFEAILNWVYEQIRASDAHDLQSLSDEITCKFDAKLEELY